MTTAERTAAIEALLSELQAVGSEVAGQLDNATDRASLDKALGALAGLDAKLESALALYRAARELHAGNR